MDGHMIVQFLSNFGYWIFIPLVIVFGPIVTIVASFMASLGVFNVWIVLLLSVVGDMIGDLLFYNIGAHWGMRFVHGLGKYIGINERRTEKLKSFFMQHGGKTIFMVKSTTGLCWATFITAGIVRMPIKKFIYYSFLGGIIWSGFLVAMGYFFGYMYERVVQYVEYAGWIIFILAIVVFVIVFFIKKRESRVLFKGVIDR